MANHLTHTPEQDKQIVERYKNGVKTRLILDEFNITNLVLYRILKKFNVPNRRFGGVTKTLTTPEQEQKIIEQYNNGIKLDNILSGFGICYIRLRKILEDNHVPTRRKPRRCQFEHHVTSHEQGDTTTTGDGILIPGDKRRNKQVFIESRCFTLPVWREEWSDGIKIAWLNCWDKEQERKKEAHK